VCRNDVTSAGTYCFAVPAGMSTDAAMQADASVDATSASDANVDSGMLGPCSGNCAAIPSCTTGTTTITGIVTAPGHAIAGAWGPPDPLPNALVYVPLGPLPPFASVMPGSCGAQPAYAVLGISGPDGSFTLSGTPAGTNVPIVIQIGRWRREVIIPMINPCVANTLLPDQTRLPRNQTEGDIPLMAMVTGNGDAMECALLKMGLDVGEFTAPAAQGGTGRVRVYVNNGANVMGSTAPASSTLFSSATELAQYDAVLMACPGAVQTAPATSDETNLIAYTTNGGRVFATHDNYVWLSNMAPFSGTATWQPGQASTASVTATIDTTFIRGMQLANWLQMLGATVTAGQIPLMAVNHDFNAVTAGQGQRWIYTATQPIHYTFDTPVGGTPAGRVAFSDFHVESVGATMTSIFPAECGAPAPLSPQERVLEYMLFDLAACVSAGGCTPIGSCAASGVSCGSARDGCGGTITCGAGCATGQTCMYGRCM
jgi:hypothetical protein